LASVCLALQEGGAFPVIGLCEQWEFMLPTFSQVLGVPQDELDCLSAGINHLTFALELHHRGRDVMPDFLARLYSPECDEIREGLPVSCAIYETYGLWPTGTEAHVAEFYNHFLLPETNGGADLGMSIRHTTQSDWDSRVAQRLGWAEFTQPIDSLLRPSGESAVPIIAALLGIHEPASFVVNVPNHGIIDNLPDEAIVEAPGYVSPSGVRGIQVGLLPEAVAHTLRTRVVQQELMVEAALTGDRQIALQAMLLDAQVTTLRVANEILDLSLEANARWLPAFE
jgi:alpha-galactosidase